jgi:hypothetical protein
MYLTIKRYDHHSVLTAQLAHERDCGVVYILNASLNAWADVEKEDDTERHFLAAK